MFNLIGIVNQIPFPLSRDVLINLKEPVIPGRLINAIFTENGTPRNPRYVYKLLVESDDINSIDVYNHYFININRINTCNFLSLSIDSESPRTFGYLLTITENYDIISILNKLVRLKIDEVIYFLQQTDNQAIINGIFDMYIRRFQFLNAKRVALQTRWKWTLQINELPIFYANEECRDLIRSLGFTYPSCVDLLIRSACYRSVTKLICDFLPYINKKSEIYMEFAIKSYSPQVIASFLAREGFSYNKDRLRVIAGNRLDVIRWINSNL